MNETFLNDFTAFLQQKGFIWGPEPEIYGGMAGFYTYAPLGKLLKNNIENRIRLFFQRSNFWEVECPTIMQKIVWEASGHLTGFSDPIITCSKCKGSFRVDNLIKDSFPELSVAPKDFLTFINEKNIKCPNCKGELVKEIKTHNLMMKTTIGLDTEAYNRPETATTTYLPVIRYVDFFRKKLPFGVFQIGKAYRNEISPRQHVVRCREFTQAEAQLFIFPEQKNNFEKYKDVKKDKLKLWPYQFQNENKEPVILSVEEALKNGYFKNKAYAWCVCSAYKLFLELGFHEERMRLRQHNLDERAFYADDAWDLEINLNSFGWIEVCGIHDRTDYDLKQHSKFSGKELVAINEKNEKIVPHILEIAFGTDRPTFALLDLSYEKKGKEEGKSILKIPPKISPVKVAIFPLLSKEKLPKIAQKIYEKLKQEFICKYDESGSIGRRYLREDESGTPFCITVDFDSIKNKDVTIRNRDTQEQKRVKISKLKKILSKLINQEIKFEELK